MYFYTRSLSITTEHRKTNCAEGALPGSGETRLK